ncbi:MAG: acyl-CoA synthetase [Deltaproteobacteria bacterium RBG_13_52_11]|nr:MAG: acyl-CoA synthetase [Deltaproteobacteria bacterium RBG_13_52_11]
MNLGRLLEERTREHPKGAALIHEGKSITFEELNKNVNRLANGLKGLGIEQGDRVAIMLPNTPEFAYSFFACQKLGAVAVPFNTMYKGGEILHILHDCEAKAIITLNSTVPLINEIKPELPLLQHIITTGERSLTFADPESTFFLQGVLSKEVFKDLDDAYQRIGDALVQGFSEMGLNEVWYKHRGSLRVGGRKLAGFSFSEIESLYILNMICFLAPFDPSDFFHVIWVPPEVKDKAIEPLTSIQEVLGRRPSDEEMQRMIVHTLEKGLEVKLKEGALKRDEIFGYEKYKSMAKKK